MPKNLVKARPTFTSKAMSLPVERGKELGPNKHFSLLAEASVTKKQSFITLTPGFSVRVSVWPEQLEHRRHLRRRPRLERRTSQTQHQPE
jgi:hypothetical protein